MILLVGARGSACGSAVGGWLPHGRGGAVSDADMTGGVGDNGRNRATGTISSVLMSEALISLEFLF